MRKHCRQLHQIDIELEVVQSSDEPGLFRVSLPYITNHMDTSREDNVINSRFLLINKP